MDTPAVPAAYSYTRFSSIEQSEGDSLRRQTAGSVEDFCGRYGLRLDTSISLRDLGVSAFKGAHRHGDKHALAQFLKLVTQGRIPPGSYLIVENLDRLTREDERTALRLWMDILDHKINIVQLNPETVFRHEKSDMFDIMRAIMELSRGHAESALKSFRVGAAWDAKRTNIGERKLTGKVPFWLRLDEAGTGFEVRQEHADLVRRIFRMSRAGDGGKMIAKKLNGESILSPYGKAWNNVSVQAILNSRSVFGEFTPHTGRSGKRTPVADAVADYYPAILAEAEFNVSRAGVDGRKRQRGRRGKAVVNVFTELLRDATDGTPMHCMEKRPGDRRYFSSGGERGRIGSRYVSISHAVVERAVLSLLREVDPREILGVDGEPDEALPLSGELAGVERRMAEIEAEMIEGDVPALARVLRTLETKRKDLADRLAIARQQAASPLSEAWGEAQSLCAVLDAAADKEEVRLRLRAVLRRILTVAWIVIVKRGGQRLAGLQLCFEGGQRRSYLVWHNPGRSYAKGTGIGEWRAQSMVRKEGLDLSNRDDALGLVEYLESMDLDAFTG